MEIVQASCSCRDRYFLKPFTHSSKRKSPFGILKHPPFRISFLSSFSLASVTTTVGTPFSPNSARKLLATSYSFLDDGDSGSVIKTAQIDPGFAVKKKALEVTDGLKGTSIYLVGINSAMKTSLGKLLAEALGYYYFDSDDVVVDAAGGEDAAKQLIETDQNGFRESETEVLRQLSAMGRLIVSAGDGAVQSATNLALLRHGISIWIDVPLDMVAKDVVEDGIQFLGSGISTSGSHSEVLSQLTMLYKEIHGGYAVADATVSLQKVCTELDYDSIDVVTAEDMCLEVLKEIEKLLRVKKMMEEAGRPF